MNCRFARCATLWCGSPPDIARVRASTLASAWYPPRRARVWFWLPYHKRIRGQLLGSLVTRGTFGRFGADIDFVRRVAGTETIWKTARNDLLVSPPQRRKIRRRIADMGDERTRNRATRYASSDCSAAPQRAVRLQFPRFRRRRWMGCSGSGIQTPERDVSRHSRPRRRRVYGRSPELSVASSPSRCFFSTTRQPDERRSTALFRLFLTTNHPSPYLPWDDVQKQDRGEDEQDEVLRKMRRLGNAET